MAAIKKLNAAKTIHLTHFSRAKNSLQAALDEEDPDVRKVGKYLAMLNEKYDKVLSDSQKMQDMLIEDDDITKEIQVREVRHLPEK